MLSRQTADLVLQVRILALMVINATYHIFDKDVVLTQILPALAKVQKGDKSSQVAMCLLGCFDAMSKTLGPKPTATHILPLVTPLLVEEALSLQSPQETLRFILEGCPTRTRNDLLSASQTSF